MDNNDKRAILNAIDEAITTVARERLLQLAGDMQSSKSLTETAQKIESSLHSLTRLQSKSIPDYDDWDALFYLTWYQPRQINLAYSVLTGIRSNLEFANKPLWIRDVSPIENGKFYFIDFGCGCLATMFAVSIAAADSIAYGNRVSRIVIECIDNSSAMIDLGEKTWGRFVSFMKEMYPKHPICRIFDGLIRYNTHTEVNLYDLETLPENTPCYLTAFHCAYEDNLDQIRSDLGSLVVQYNPDGVVLTTQAFKNESRILRHCLPPTALGGYKEKLIHDHVKTQFEGALGRVTDWRINLLGILSQSKEEISLSCDYGLIQNYLTNAVEWNYNNVAYHLYSSDKNLKIDNRNDDLDIEYSEFLRYRERNWWLFDEY